MSPASNNFYAQWRVRSGVFTLLRDDRDSPPERLLQAVWQHQRLRRDQLKSSDGQSVRVLHPGFRSQEGGPDFRGALIQLDDGPPRAGDVEIDVRTTGWHAHGHDRNPSFNQVILHVVWETERSVAEALPVLPLRSVLDAPLGELSLWLRTDSAQSFPEDLRGQCCADLRGLQTGQRLALLHQAAQVRLQSKAAQFGARARQAGWEQSLWEGLFRALGYKHNVWPMQRLAELRERWSPGTPDPIVLQARLFGISGLLPVELAHSPSETDVYVRRVWDQWWRERDQFSDCMLPRVLWHLHGLRPANNPQRRLALASAWSASRELATRLERWCTQDAPDQTLAASLLEALRVQPDEFWSWHWTLRSARLRKAQLLLGATRATDLAVNVVLPWLWIRAVEGGNQPMQSAIEHRYYHWPLAQDNAVLRLARQRLLGETSPRCLPDAAAQQGLTQIVRDFCDRSNAACGGCRFPALLREFVGTQG